MLSIVDLTGVGFCQLNSMVRGYHYGKGLPFRGYIRTQHNTE